MNTRSIFVSLVFATASVVLFSSCSGKKESGADEHGGHEHAEAVASDSSATKSGATFTVDAAFQQQLGDVFKSYVTLKDAFVSSNATTVKTEAKSTKESLAKADMKLLSGAAHNDWMNYLSGMETALGEIEGAADIGAQRKAFSTLTENLYKSIKAYGLGGTTAYYDFCPMAFNNQGGYWLSNEDKIRNPYFGDEMLTCGSVTETLQ